MRNNNSFAIRNLTWKYIKENKSRNIFAIIAIILTTLLFTSIFTISMSVKNSFEQETMRRVGTSSHAGFKYLNEDQMNILKEHKLIKEYGYVRMLAMAENEELIKRQTQIQYETKNSAEWGFLTPKAGRLPESIDEIATDTIVLKALGIEAKIGEKIRFRYTLEDKTYDEEFTLSGYWDGDMASMASMVLVSKDYSDKMLAGINQLEHQKMSDYSGLYYLNFNLYSEKDIEGDTIKIIEESGFDTREIDYGINWAYVSTSLNFDAKMILAIVGICLLIMFTGYLIIYNIFQISITTDIQFYGLLKTIGTTQKQIKKMIKTQALYLSAIGIPLGLITGYAVGILLLPRVIAILNVSKQSISMDARIFVFAAVFSLITVWISCRKPGKFAAKISPIEASKWNKTGNLNISSWIKIPTKNKAIQMGQANLGRNRNKTLVVIASLSLSLILLNSVHAIVNGFDMDKYLKKDVISDYQIGHAKYFSSDFRGDDESIALSDSQIKEIESKEGFKSGSKVYYFNLPHTLNDIGKKHIQGIITDEFISERDPEMKYSYEKMREDGDILFQTYGIDQKLIEKLKVTKGNIDIARFNTGNYAILSPYFTDANDSRSFYDVGDKITLEGRAIEVMAIADMPHVMTSRYSFSHSVDLILSYEGFEQIVMSAQKDYEYKIEKPLVMSYIFDVENEYISEFDSWLEEFTNDINPQLDYKSKKKYIETFDSLKRTYTVVGGVLIAIVSLIGLLNLINTTMTSIISRKAEFKLLNSIGMTQKQIKQMLQAEGICIALYTSITAITLGSVLSYFIVNTIAGDIWFFTYHFSILPMLVGIAVLFVVSVKIMSTSKWQVKNRIEK